MNEEEEEDEKLVRFILWQNLIGGLTTTHRKHTHTFSFNLNVKFNLK